MLTFIHLNIFDLFFFLLFSLCPFKLCIFVFLDTVFFFFLVFDIFVQLFGRSILIRKDSACPYRPNPRNDFVKPSPVKNHCGRYFAAFFRGDALRHFWRGGLERPLRSLRIKTITDNTLDYIFSFLV